jgi:hypothetical protein
MSRRVIETSINVSKLPPFHVVTTYEPAVNARPEAIQTSVSSDASGDESR